LKYQKNQQKKKKKGTVDRHFRAEWTEEISCLIEKNGKTYWKLCMIYIKGGGYHVRRHAKSTLHMKKFNAAKDTPEASVLLKVHQPTITEQTKIMEHKIVAFLCDNNLSLSLVNELIPFLKELIPDNEILKNLKLKRDKATDILNHELGPYSKKLTLANYVKESFR
jgi:hypothetical protein